MQAICCRNERNPQENYRCHTVTAQHNLTPITLRMLDAVSVSASKFGCPVSSIEVFSLHSTQKLGEVPSPSSNGGGSNRRRRKDLQEATLSIVRRADITVEFGSRLVRVPEIEDSVTAGFGMGRRRRQTSCSSVMACIPHCENHMLSRPAKPSIRRPPQHMDCLITTAFALNCTSEPLHSRRRPTDQ